MAAGTVAVNFVANTKPFGKGVKSARKDLGLFNKGLAGVTTSLRSLGSGLLAVAGIGGFATFIKGQLTAIDLLAKTSDKLGLTTEQLGLYQFAGGLAGVANEELSKSFEMMGKNVSDATRGFGLAKEALKFLNIDAAKLKTLDPAKQFRMIGEAINRLPNATDKLGISKAIFGRGGASLINLFASDLAKVAKEYENIGGAANRVDSAKIEKLNDELSKLAQTFAISGREFVIDISDAAIAAVESLRKVVGFLRSGGKGSENKFVAGAAGIAAKAASGLNVAAVAATHGGFALRSKRERGELIERGLLSGVAKAMTNISIAFTTQAQLTREMRDAMLINPQITPTNQF